MTSPILFAQARGESYTPGAQRCFYCGGACTDDYPVAKYVADSFTERNTVACPASGCVCGGCVACLRSDLGSVPLIDGSTHHTKADGKRKPKDGAAGTIQVRWFSWIVTQDSAVAATPSHRELLLTACLSPPEPPFAICLADGNKHQLYKTPVNYSRERIAVNCEGTRVDYHPDELRDRLQLVMRLVAVIGKGSNSIARLLDTTQDGATALQLSKHYADYGELIDAWRTVRVQPLTDLAIFLSPGKQECNERLDSSTA